MQYDHKCNTKNTRKIINEKEEFHLIEKILNKKI